MTEHNNISKISSIYDQIIWNYMEQLVALFYDDEKWRCKNQNLRCHQMLHCSVFTKYFKCLQKFKIVLKLSDSQESLAANLLPKSEMIFYYI